MSMQLTSVDSVSPNPAVDGLPRFTQRSIVNTQDYLAELHQVRRGMPWTREEYLPGVKAVAVAVGNQRGLPLAIWVVGFADAMGKNAVPEIVVETGRAAARLCESLGRLSQDAS